MEQIRIHGRGGQGVVTAAELIATAAFFDGLEAQAFPNFGVERTGAPIQAYTRLSQKKIITREQIYEPTVLIIQDSTLLETTNVFFGVNEDTKVIINSPKDKIKKLPHPARLLKKQNIYFSPATEIALEIIGKNITNTVILGALAKNTKLISLASLKRAIREKFSDKGESVIAKNIQAVEKAYNS